MKKTILALSLAAAAVPYANAQEVVKIGHAAPLTGSIAHQGKDNENGVRLALEEVNAKGTKIGGKQIKFELMGEDDQADPRTATTVAQRLVDAGVKGVVGHMNSGASIPASRIYDAAGIPMISPDATNPKLTLQGYKGVFRTIANDVQQGIRIGKFVLGFGKKIAIIDDRTAYGQGLADEVEKAAKAGGATIVAREFTSNQSTDFNAILTKIRAANPDAIMFAGEDAQAGPMLKQIKQLGIAAKWITGDAACTPELIKIAGDSLGANDYCTRAGLPNEALPDKTFRERFKKRFGADVQVSSPNAYDAAMALITAMKMADSTDPAKYLPFISKVNFKGVSGDIAFDANGDIKSGIITVYHFENNDWKPVK